jgi:hypothetical protein
LQAQTTTAREWMLAGPAETGKTFAALWRLDSLLASTPHAQAVIARKIRTSINSTALVTFRRVSRLSGSGAAAYGGERPDWYDYPNGSRLWVAGMDDAQKVLSSERDFIYVNQAEELSLSDWETLTTRVTGRGAVTATPMLFGDCNPGPPHHWIKNRPSLAILESRHEDNPTRWVSAEGTVYQFEPAVHVVEPFPIPRHWTRFRSVDFGYSNPFVCQFWTVDDDGRMYLYREIYRSGRIVADHARQIRQLTGDERIAATIADHDREDRETLHRCGIHTLPADKAIAPGIQAVEQRLVVQPDGKPRLMLFRGALVERDEELAEKKLPVCTEQEFDVYAWPKGADGKPNKEVPVDLHNHSMDALRYAVRWADARQRTRGLIAEAKGQAAPEKARHLAEQLPPGVFG